MPQVNKKESIPNIKCTQCGGTDFSSTPLVVPGGLPPVLDGRINYGLKGYICKTCSHIEIFLSTANGVLKAYRFWIIYATTMITAFALLLIIL